MVITDNGKVVSSLIRAQLAEFSFSQPVTDLPPPVRCLATAIEDKLHLQQRAIAAASQVALIKGMFQYLTLYPEIKVNPIGIAISPFPLTVDKVSESISMDGIIEVPSINDAEFVNTIKASVAVSLPRILGTVFIADTADAAAIRRSMMKEFILNLVAVLNLPPNKVFASNFEGSQYVEYTGRVMFLPPSDIDAFVGEVNTLMDSTLSSVTDPAQMFKLSWDVIGTVIYNLINNGNRLIGAVGGLSFARGAGLSPVPIPAVIVGVTTKNNVAVPDEPVAKLSFFVEFELFGKVIKFFKRIDLKDLIFKIRIKRPHRGEWIDWDLEFDISALIGKIEAILGNIIELITNVIEKVTDVINKVIAKVNEVILIIVNVVRRVLEAIGAAIEYIKEKIAEIIAFAAKIIQAIIDAIWDIINALIRKMVDAFNLIATRLTLALAWDGLMNLTPPPSAFIAKVMYKLAEIERFVIRAVQFVANVIGRIINVITAIINVCKEIVAFVLGIIELVIELAKQLLNIKCSNEDCQNYNDESICDRSILKFIGIPDSIKPTEFEGPEIPATITKYTRLHPNADGTPIVVNVPTNNENYSVMMSATITMDEEEDKTSEKFNKAQSDYTEAQLRLEAQLDDPSWSIPDDVAKPDPADEAKTTVDYTRKNPDNDGNPIVVKVPSDNEHILKMGETGDPTNEEYIAAQDALEADLDELGVLPPFDFADDEVVKGLIDTLLPNKLTAPELPKPSFDIPVPSYSMA